MANKSLATELLDKMHALEETYRALLDERAANRRVLRDLDAQGLLNDEESRLVNETYPPRQRSEETEEAAA